MKKKAALEIINLRVAVDNKEILKGITLTVQPGRVQAVMGPNGSGKSTLASAIMGHPTYQVKSQKSKVKSGIFLGGKNITDLPAEERAKKGLFLAFQSPIAIPGVSVVNLLRTAYQEIYGSNHAPNGQASYNPVLARRWRVTGLSLSEFTTKLKEYAKRLHFDESLLNRGIHDEFSGGEKKKIEMLQALILSPKFAIFDEIDTGLDVDALKAVAAGIDLLRQDGVGIILITHYQRILKYLKPDVVHVLVGGRLVAEGGASLARQIEASGYRKYLAH